VLSSSPVLHGNALEEEMRTVSKLMAHGGVIVKVAANHSRLLWHILRQNVDRLFAYLQLERSSSYEKSLWMFGRCGSMSFGCALDQDKFPPCRRMSAHGMVGSRPQMANARTGDTRGWRIFAMDKGCAERTYIGTTTVRRSYVRCSLESSE
jgi:hypothetical protein